MVPHWRQACTTPLRRTRSKTHPAEGRETGEAQAAPCKACISRTSHGCRPLTHPESTLASKHTHASIACVCRGASGSTEKAHLGEGGVQGQAGRKSAAALALHPGAADVQGAERR